LKPPAAFWALAEKNRAKPTAHKGNVINLVITMVTFLMTTIKALNNNQNDATIAAFWQLYSARKSFTAGAAPQILMGS